MDVPSVFVMSMASKKMSNRSRKVLLGASNDTLEVARAKKVVPPAKVPYSAISAVLTVLYHSVDEIAVFGQSGPLFFARLTLKVSSEASSRTFLDRLDINFDAIDMANTLGTSIPRHG